MAFFMRRAGNMMTFALLVTLVVCISSVSALEETIPTLSPTPAPTFFQAIQQLNESVEAITPQVELISNLFSSDVNEELPEQETLATTVRFEWERLLNTTSSEEAIAAPFVICSNGGRSGIVKMLSHISQETHAPLPLYASANLTCYIIQSYALDVINQTVHSTNIVYSAPVLSQLKLSKGLFSQAYAGELIMDDQLCSAGIRVVLAPGIGEVKRNLFSLIRNIKNDLVQGKYAHKVLEAFIWADGGINNEAATSADEHRRQISKAKSRTTTTRLRSNKHGQGKAAAENADDEHGGANAGGHLPARGHMWSEKINPVLNSSVSCDWSALLLTAQVPYIRIDGYCRLAEDMAKASDCLVTLLAFLSTEISVLYIEPFPVLKSWNVYAGGITQSGSIDAFPMWDVGLDGSNQVIQVADTGLDIKSCWFNDSTGNVETTTYSTAAYDSTRRKVVQYVVWADNVDVDSGHGTHVSGTVAGKCEGESTEANALNSQYAGLAPAAKIAFYDAGNSAGRLSFPSNLKLKVFPPGYTAGARIFCNSWGSTSNSYTYLDTEVDQYMLSYPDTLILVAGGNAGTSGGNTVYSPGLSKNGICVGASESLRDSKFDISAVAYFSSRGPTADGRIKPDFVAPGYKLYSANAGSSCSVIDKQGTSMSTPIASAGAALVRQYFMDGYYPTGKNTSNNSFVPTGALMKAMLINSAVPMSKYVLSTGGFISLGLPPDNYQGFGRLELDEVLKLDSSLSLWVADAVSIVEGESHVYKFSIPKEAGINGIKPFKVTLTWMDPYTSATSATLVLHNLDLSMMSALTAKTYYPNGLTVADDKNTVEKIVEYDPTKADVYTVTVSGTSVSTSPTQSYAIVASGTFFSGAWYCQNPLLTRTDLNYRTEYCQISCGVLNKNPVCCSTIAGDICSSSEMLSDQSVCDAAAKPWDCQSPTPAPTCDPTTTPTPAPTFMPSKTPTGQPTKRPTAKPTLKPSKKPTPNPTIRPSKRPSPAPSKRPSKKPSPSPSVRPSKAPTSPTKLPTKAPTVPTTTPTRSPTSPTRVPTTPPPTLFTISPSQEPTKVPSLLPTVIPSIIPSGVPTREPTIPPSLTPTDLPSQERSRLPTLLPTLSPTRLPSNAPTKFPSVSPTQASISPTKLPTKRPSRKPTRMPTKKPTIKPTSPPNVIVTTPSPTLNDLIIGPETLLNTSSFGMESGALATVQWNPVMLLGLMGMMTLGLILN